MLRLVVVLQGAQEIGVGAVVRGDRLGREVEWFGAIGGAIQLTTPVQRIDRSRLGGGEGDRNR
ncbi:MAG: hypothetical protein HC899_40045 [Leptolyngbyaceae cyanobacterium SM1_4_3]|nr:hypothetical protein [Leptolyngbyaceae cyanobacterium SM1_4_3]